MFEFYVTSTALVFFYTDGVLGVLLFLVFNCFTAFDFGQYCYGNEKRNKF